MEPISPGTTSMSDELLRRKRMRSYAIAAGLVAMCVVFYLITIFRMGGEVLKRQL
jgi:hypothetical protein